MSTPVTASSAKDNSDATQYVAQKAARGTLVAVILRLFSFLGTQYCLRRLDPSSLGRAHLQLELLASTILFISRDGFRLALIKTHTCFQTAWLTVPLSTALSLIALGLHLWRCSTNGSSISSNTPLSQLNVNNINTSMDETNANEMMDYRMAGYLYCFAAAVEGWAEPAVLWFLNQSMSVAEKATAEGIANLIKTFSTILLLRFYHNGTRPISALGLAQCMYAGTYFAILYGILWWRQFRPKSMSQSFLPWIDTHLLLDPTTLQLIGVFTIQGLFKFALQEGDRIILAILSNSYDQGVYAMGSAYGGLVARLILQPIEENARILFGRMASALDDRGKSSSTQPDIHPKCSSETKLRLIDPKLELSYIVLVKGVLYIGFLFGCLATNYTAILLNLLAGSKWGNNSEAVSVLSGFCIYTAFLAWNGVTEAFVYGVASTTSDMTRLSAAHTISGIIFAISAVVAVHKFGTVGVVAANCVAMLGRALFSVHFAARYLYERSDRKESVGSVMYRLIRKMFPSIWILLMFVAAFVFTHRSMNYMSHQMIVGEIEARSITWLRLAAEHIKVGASFGVMILTIAYMVEIDFRRNVRILWHGKAD